MRTPLKNARHLGSAKEGSDHFWKQRVTAVSNLVLVLFLVWFIASLAGAGQPAIKHAFANPLVALAFSALIISGTIHMRLGMQTIIEDYVRGEGPKIVLLMLNTFFTAAIALASLFSILKLSFGA